jgi:ubiquinone/menaquinone biosynthesis C-methylase UbiE
MNIQAPETAIADLAAVKSRQHAAWSAGDYSIVGTTLQIVGETLCETVDLRAGERVLDVAAGNGNATLAAARRFAEVVSTDYVGSLLDHGRERAKADRLPITFLEADAEELPFESGSFDVVLSSFGVMFVTDHEKAAGELLRVCRSGGRIGLASWTPESFIGRLFKVIGAYIPPAPGVRSPALWGKEAYLRELVGPRGSVAAQSRTFVFRYRSPEHWVEIFRTYYGPVLKAFAALDPKARLPLERDLHILLDEFNVARDGTVVIPSEYLEAVITKAR